MCLSDVFVLKSRSNVELTDSRTEKSGPCVEMRADLLKSIKMTRAFFYSKGADPEHRLKVLQPPLNCTE